MKNLTHKQCKKLYIYMASFAIVTLVSTLFLIGVKSILSIENIDHNFYVLGYATLFVLATTAIVLVAKILVNTHISSNESQDYEINNNDSKW